MNKEKLETKAMKHPSWKDVGITDPRTRLKSLSDYASNVEVDRNIPPQRYLTFIKLIYKFLSYNFLLLCHLTVLISYVSFIPRYYRSGVEMIRMADTYMKENDLEHAYCLYVKFIT